MLQFNPAGEGAATPRSQQLISSGMQASGLLGLTAAFFGLHLEVSQLAGILVGISFVFTADQVLHAFFAAAPILCQGSRV